MAQKLKKIGDKLRGKMRMLSVLCMQNPFSHWCLKSRGRPTLR